MSDEEVEEVCDYDKEVIEMKMDEHYYNIYRIIKDYTNSQNLPILDRGGIGDLIRYVDTYSIKIEEKKEEITEGEDDEYE